MDKSALLREVAAFRKNRDAAPHDLRRAFLMAKFGISGMGELSRSTPLRLAGLIRQIRRGLSQERMRGVARHRLYDLNRHIALKALLDEIIALPQMQNGAEAPLRKAVRRRRDQLKSHLAESAGAVFEKPGVPASPLGL